MDYKVKEIELPNGAKGLLVDVKGAKVMRFSLGFMGGSLMCPADKLEIAHTLEHMVLKANEEYREEKDFVMEICKNGADTNAFTGGDSIEYVASCPDFEWERVLKLLTMGLAKPLFSPGHFETEMKVVREELTAYLDNYTYIVQAAVDRDARNLDFMPEKRVKLLDNIALGDLKRFYARTHFAANMRFVIAGDLADKEEAVKRIMNQIDLGSDSGQRFKRVESPFRPVDGPIALDRKAAGKMYFEFQVAKENGRRLSLEERVCLGILHDILIGYGGAILASRINGQARDRGLTYGINGGWSFLDAGHVRFGGSVEKANADALFKLIAAEIRKILDGKLSETEVEAVKRRLVGDHYQEELNTGRLINHYDSYLVLHEDEDYEDYDTRVKLLPAIKREQVLQTYRQIFSSDRWYLGLVGADTEALSAKLYRTIGTIFKT